MTSLPLRNQIWWTWSLTWSKGEGIKGLILQAKFYPPLQAAAAADRALRLPKCASHNAWDDPHSISCIAACAILCIAACALQQLPSNLWLPQSTSRNPRGRMIHLVDCGSTAVGVEVPQFKPSYTVPSKGGVCLGVSQRVWLREKCVTEGKLKNCTKLCYVIYEQHLTTKIN